MPIKTLQQQQAQVGRIRLGQQVPGSNGKKRPARLEQFRFTTPNEDLAVAVSTTYGGDVVRWTPDGRPAEWEVISPATSLTVLVPPNPVSQWYEMWSGQGCVRRCDGETDALSGNPCACPADPAERGVLAADGKVCKATTRLKVMLPDLPGIGVWRLDSHGYYAAIELPGTAEFLGAATEQGGYVRATLTLETRQVRRVGVGVRQFLVPALHVDVTPLALLGGQGLALSGTGPRALPTADRVALDAGPSAADLAQRYADDARAATTPDQLRDIYVQAGKDGADVMNAQVLTEGDITEKLDSYLTARGRALLPVTEPGQLDVLWESILDHGGQQGLDLATVTARFRTAIGVEPSAATEAQLRSYLDTLAVAS